jgi:hypothetical protein
MNATEFQEQNRTLARRGELLGLARLYGNNAVSAFVETTSSPSRTAAVDYLERAAALYTKCGMRPSATACLKRTVGLRYEDRLHKTASYVLDRFLTFSFCLGLLDGFVHECCRNSFDLQALDLTGENDLREEGIEWLRSGLRNEFNPYLSDLRLLQGRLKDDLGSDRVDLGIDLLSTGG